jgi:hypothetical protein
MAILLKKEGSVEELIEVLEKHRDKKLCVAYANNNEKHYPIRYINIDDSKGQITLA